MPQILDDLRQYPVAFRLSLPGPVIAARHIAHARLKKDLDNGRDLPQYIKDHVVYYAGPAKTPQGYASGSFGPITAGPITAGRMAPYVDLFQSQGASMVMLAKGNRSRQVSQACARHGGFYRGPSVGPPPAWPSTASRRWRWWITRIWGWRPSGRSRWRTSPPSSSSTTRAATSTPNCPPARAAG